MADSRLEDIADLVQAAFRDSRLFKREPPGTDLLTVEQLRVEAHTYVALLAGDKSATHPALRGNVSRSRMLREFPLRVREGGEVQVCMVLRPVTAPADAESSEQAAPFAPHENLPWVAMREFHLRLFDLANNRLGLRSLRVEYDARAHRMLAQETWLRRWQRALGMNPAHTPWHVHINSGDDVGPAERGEFSDDDLRLALSTPNPLALVLSFAAWYQRILLQRYGRG